MSAKRCLRRESVRPVRRLRMEPLEDRTLLAGWVFGIGSDTQGLNDIAVDDEGNSYVVGNIPRDTTVDCDPGPGSTLLSNDSLSSGFVAKYSSDKALLWARQFQTATASPVGEPQDWTLGSSVAIDTDGNAYVNGWFAGTAQFGDTTLVSYGSARDIFISKLDSEGEFQWAVRYGDAGRELSKDIAVDDEGDVYLTGRFEATIEFGNTILTSEGYEDIYIAKLDGTDGHALWAHRAGSAETYETGMAIVASQGAIYVAGEFNGTVQFGDTTLTGYSAAFVTRLDATSGDFLWARKIGESDARAYDLTVDRTGNVYVVGFFSGTAKFGQQELTAAGLAGFLTKMDSQGNFLWARSVGGVEVAVISGVVVHTDGTLHVTGRFMGTADFDPGPQATSRTSAGGFDSFVLKLDAEGHYLDLWQMSGPDAVRSGAIGADPAGNCYIVGTFMGTASFPDGTLTSAGDVEQFVMKLGDAIIHRIDAQGDTYAIDEDDGLVVPLPGVLDNDTHSGGYALTATLADGPSHGTLSLNADGSFTYEPNLDFHGTDSFTYLASDGDIDSNGATVTITINPVNDVPLAVDDSYTTDVNVALLPPAPGLLDNDEDVEGDSLKAIIVTQPAHFLALQLNSDGSFAYFPETDYQGPDSFTYKVNDGQADSNVATVTITVGNSRHPGDADLSGATDLSDFNIWNANKFIQGTDWTSGDFNGDSVTDLSDFNIWNAHKFTQAPAPAPVDVAMAQKSDGPEMSAGRLAGLLAATQADSGKQPSNADGRAKAAVDMLLATYWGSDG